MGIDTWEWEGMGIKNPFPNTSRLDPCLQYLHGDATKDKSPV